MACPSCRACKSSPRTRHGRRCPVRLELARLAALAAALHVAPWRMLKGLLLTPRWPRCLAALVLAAAAASRRAADSVRRQPADADAGLASRPWCWRWSRCWSGASACKMRLPLAQWVWLGLAPATLALLLGPLLQALLPVNPFVHTLGRVSRYRAGGVRRRLAAGARAALARWRQPARRAGGALADGWGDAF